jgi:hypothetical protein
MNVITTPLQTSLTLAAKTVQEKKLADFLEPLPLAENAKYLRDCSWVAFSNMEGEGTIAT